MLKQEFPSLVAYIHAEGPVMCRTSSCPHGMASKAMINKMSFNVWYGICKITFNT
jgi:hypothetical protein